MTAKTLRAAKMLADSSGDDQSLDDIIAALCGYGPLMHHSGNQLASMLVRHILQANAGAEAKITPHILRNWDRARIVAFAKHLLGDECQACLKHNAPVVCSDDDMCIDDLTEAGWTCDACPRSRVVRNRKLECNFQDCVREFRNRPNAAGQARAVASRHEPACSRLVCDQCGTAETPPYDEGDACVCGGVFRSANAPADRPRSGTVGPDVRQGGAS